MAAFKFSTVQVEFYLQKVKSQDNGNSTKESGKKEGKY